MWEVKFSGYGDAIGQPAEKECPVLAVESPGLPEECSVLAGESPIPSGRGEVFGSAGGVSDGIMPSRFFSATGSATFGLSVTSLRFSSTPD